ncbi:MAG: hypothetical protein ACM3U1_11850 [Chloroflexota bacterium]
MKDEILRSELGTGHAELDDLPGRIMRLYLLPPPAFPMLYYYMLST